MKVRLYIQTISYLKFIQLFYQIYYRLKKKLPVHYPLSIPKTGKEVTLLPFIAKPVCLKGKECSFLNLYRLFEGDWNNVADGKLWTYNLNYMDFLLQTDINFETGSAWIDHFIQHISHRCIGMDSYVISLRSVNWIKFISINAKKISPEQKQSWDASLYAQYCHLKRNIEYHLLGNHLLENGFSFLWGAFYFGDFSLFYKARQILMTELEHQILPDGGHFELSPMYHAILTERVLDSLNLLQNNFYFEEQEKLSYFLEQKATVMLGWLNTVIYATGNLPLTNDAANGIAPSVFEIFNYAKRLHLDWGAVSLKDSGYRKLQAVPFELLIDVGAIGADYQPGHAHADTFNFELYVNGRPAIIDTGTSTYEANKVRFYERSTAAHNTVVVQGRNSSEVWGAHRVARRAKVKIVTDHSDCVEAVHDGYRALGIMHFRKIRKSEKGFEIEDHITGRGEAYLHFHPDEKIEIKNGRVESKDYRIVFSGALSITEKESWYAPEFNKRISNRCLQITFEEQLLTFIEKQ